MLTQVKSFKCDNQQICPQELKIHMKWLWPWTQDYILKLMGCLFSKLCIYCESVASQFFKKKKRTRFGCKRQTLKIIIYISV